MTVHHLERPPQCRRCKSPDTQLRKKIASNNVRMYSFQCLRCGENASGWISHSRIPNLNIPDWDETLSKNYYLQQAQQRLVLRETERADWLHEHDEYLKSPQWRALRKKVFARANNLCEGCRDRPPSQVHHLSYANWKHEFLWELVAICDECHERAHRKTDQETGNLRGLLERALGDAK